MVGFKKTPDLKQLVYTLDLNSENTEPLQFTLRFKSDENSPWIWSKDQTGAADGRLVFQVASDVIQQDPFHFSELFEKPDCALSAKAVLSQVSGVEVFEVVANALPLSNTSSIVVLGTPLLLENYYALVGPQLYLWIHVANLNQVKLSSAWMGPRQGTTPFVVDNDALMAGYIRSDGRHVVVLGVSGIDDCTTYVHASTGRVVLKTRNDGTVDQYHRAIVATGWEYQRTVDAAFYKAREMIRALVTQSDSAKKEEENLEDEPAPVPAWYETWSVFFQGVVISCGI